MYIMPCVVATFRDHHIYRIFLSSPIRVTFPHLGNLRRRVVVSHASSSSPTVSTHVALFLCILYDINIMEFCRTHHQNRYYKTCWHAQSQSRLAMSQPHPHAHPRVPTLGSRRRRAFIVSHVELVVSDSERARSHFPSFYTQ